MRPGSRWLGLPVEGMSAHLGYLLLIVGFSGVWCLIRFNHIPVGSFFDDAHYLVLAESLATGRGYQLINFPHAPVETAFPPGWPLLLMPVTAVFPGSLFWPKLLAFAFWLAAIPLVNRLLGSRLPAFLALPFFVIFALNPHLVGMADTVMSEAAYLFFTLLALVFLQQWVAQPEKRTSWRLLALGAATFAALLVRTIGVALVVVVVVSLLRNLRGRPLRWLFLAVGLATAVFALLALFNQRLGGTLIFSQTYSEHLAYLLPRLADFLRFWQVGTAVSLETVANAVVPIFELQAVTAVLTPLGVQVLAVLVLLLVAVGFAVRCRQMTAVEWYVLAYLAIFYVWTVYINTVQLRILLPLIPFMTFYWGTAVLQLGGWFLGKAQPERLKRFAQLGFALLLLLHLGRNVYATLNPVSNDLVDLAASVAWMNDNLPPDAVVMTPNPVPDYLYLRRLTVEFPQETAVLTQTIADQGVDYILIRPNLASNRHQDGLDPKGVQLLQLIQSKPSQFRLVHRDPLQQVWVYQIERGL